ncbi:purine-rich element-binding protein gamma [Grus japonensis]|uniref:Purine-rich element-binding protein gamma n=1 Tax=Grus japonensis TaxID=30415 RepID=A0ABC9WWJ9_GRUJA
MFADLVVGGQTSRGFNGSPRFLKASCHFRDDPRTGRHRDSKPGEGKAAATGGLAEALGVLLGCDPKVQAHVSARVASPGGGKIARSLRRGQRKQHASTFTPGGDFVPFTPRQVLRHLRRAASSLAFRAQPWEVDPSGASEEEEVQVPSEVPDIPATAPSGEVRKSGCFTQRGLRKP